MFRVLFFISIILNLSANTQTLKSLSINNGGERVEDSTHSISYTIGQTNVGTLNNNEFIRMGFQQPSINLNSQILSDTTRGVNCNNYGFIYTTINGIFTNGGTNITNWYYLDTLSGNWVPLVPSSSYITSGLIAYNNPNLQGLSSDSLITLIGGTFKLEIVNSGNIIEDTTWFIRYPLDLKLCCHVDINCHGDSTGSFKAVGHSGKPPYTYFFYDSSFSLISIGTDSIYDNLSSGKYYVSVMDQDSCLVTSPEIIISQTSKITAQKTVSDVLCHGDSTGSATLIFSGGVPDYLLGWNGFNYPLLGGLNVFTTPIVVPAGIYPFSVSDLNGCTLLDTFTISEPNPISVVIADTTCDYYTWNGSNFSHSGSYIDTLINSSGCDSIVTLNLTINNSDTSYINVTACDSFTWQGTTYTQSGIYYFHQPPMYSQLGQNIDGENAGDNSGRSVSISSNGNTVAIGGWWNDGNGQDAGHVRIYDWNGSSWLQRGNDIDGEYTGDCSGHSVSLSSDGNTVAIGAWLNDGNGNNAGHVRIYDWNGSNWIQIGNDIDGENAGDWSGFSVSLSSGGNTVAIGAPNNNDNGFFQSGHVRIYDWSGGSWVKRGQDIYGESGQDNSGRSVSLSIDGNTLAVGALYNDGNGQDAGHVRIYDWSGTWIQRGNDIDGENAVDHSGQSVSLSSDGNIVAIGAADNDGNGYASGHVRIYDWDGSMWTQKGQDINGEAPSDRSGCSVSLSSDGNTVAIGARHNDGNGSNAGHVRIYDWDGISWIHKGVDINGESAGDEFGQSVSLSSDGNKVAIGAPWNDGNGQDAGHVRIYQYSSFLTVSGCDSVLALNLTINNSSESHTYYSTCDNSYSWNGVTYGLTGTYSSIFTSANGCDSTAYLHLTMLDETYSTQNLTSCDSVLFNGSTYYFSGTFTDTLINSNGCDSILTLNVIVTTSGCTDPLAYNYDPNAVCDDGSCAYCAIYSISLTQTPVTCSNWNDGSAYVSVTGIAPSYTYLWSTGATTAQIDNLIEGTYSVTVSDGNCSITDSIIVGLGVAPADSMSPEICYVSVDNTGFNKVVLRPLANNLVNEYVILRESSSNLYISLDTLDANTLTYIDSTSNPAVQAERYKVSAIDACGNNSDMSDYHKTVHLTMSLGVNGEVNLIWNQYEGYQVSDYLIYRGNSASSMNMIGMVSGTNISYTDLNPPTGFLQYQIRAFAQNCNPITSYSAMVLPDTLESNVVDHNNTPVVTLNVSIIGGNPSCATCTDGFAIANAVGGTPPYTYVWTNGSISSINQNLGVGTYTVYIFDALNNTATATVTLISSSAPITGCTDPLATNYDPLATVDDSSCTYSTSCTSPSITGLGVGNVIHNRATLTFDDMNSSSCRVDQLRIKYREVGTSAWSQKNMGSPTGYDPVTGICNSTSRTDKLLLGLSSNTTYEWQMRVWYCSTGNTPWVNGPNFTTLGDCPNVGNLAVTTPNSTKATFTWDNSNGAYSFVRLQGRVDTLGSSFFNIGGVGVQYGTYTKNKNGLVPGTSYRAKSRTWCDPNGGAYKAPSWTSFIYFTMPGSIKLEQSTLINDLDIYPNPSRDVFNISFKTVNKQDITLRIRNIVGEEIYTEELNQFDGTYTKAISLENYPKAVYFLEINTTEGTINKKLILQ